MQYTKKEFLKSLKSRLINVTISVNNMTEFSLADNFGTKYKLSTPEAFLERVSLITKKDLSDFTYSSPYWTNEPSQVVVEPQEQASESVLEESEASVPQVEETFSEAVTEVIEEPIVEALLASEEPKQPDWKWIESLENNKEDKLLLDDYADKEFSIKLSRTKKLSNMIIDFKAAL